jgi:hypothetical protein
MIIQGAPSSWPSEQRRNVRQRLAKPRLDELATWLDAQQQRIPGKSDLAGAIRYARSRWPALADRMPEALRCLVYLDAPTSAFSTISNSNPSTDKAPCLGPVAARAPVSTAPA